MHSHPDIVCFHSPRFPYTFSQFPGLRPVDPSRRRAECRGRDDVFRRRRRDQWDAAESNKSADESANGTVRSPPRSAGGGGSPTRAILRELVAWRLTTGLVALFTSNRRVCRSNKDRARARRLRGAITTYVFVVVPREWMSGVPGASLVTGHTVGHTYVHIHTLSHTYCTYIHWPLFSSFPGREETYDRGV